jgi:hypothetical protein
MDGAKMKREARKKMLKKMKSLMKDDIHSGMKDSLKGLQKVTVASDSKEGLEAGLDKAKKIMEGRKESEGDDFACGGKKEYKDGGYDEDDKKSKIMKALANRK